MDGTTHTITVTIHGVNDAPVVADEADNTGYETPVTRDVLENDSDPDGDTLTVTDPTVDPNKGTVVQNPDGTLTFTPAPGVTGEVTITYTVEDGQGGTGTGTWVVTVGGTPSTIGGDDVGDVTEDLNVTAGKLTDTGTLTITDPNPAEAAFTPGAGTAVGSVLGSLTIDATGVWNYEVDNSAVQYLKAGETKVEEFTVQGVDGTTHTITVTIHGVNDVPSFGGDDQGAVTEDQNVTAGKLTDTGTLTVTDPDQGESQFTPGAGTPVGTALGSLSIDANGNWTYTVDNSLSAVQNLNAGDSIEERFTVQSVDGTEHEIVVTIHGADEPNVPPVVSASTAPELDEGLLPGGIPGGAANPHVTGEITIQDSDSNSFDVTLAGPSGVTSGGQAVTWQWNDTTKTLTGTAGGKEVMTVEIGATTHPAPGSHVVEYTVTQKAAIDHPSGMGENVKNLQFTATVSDGEDSATPVTLTVPVKDDMPVLADVTVGLNVEPQQTNLLIIFDNSDSMVELTPSGETRLEVAQKAVKALIDQYAAYGEVKVQLVVFSSTAEQLVDHWMTVDEAKAAVDSIYADASTNYDAALAQAMETFDTAGKLSGANTHNASFFLTDGTPTRGDGNPDALNNLGPGNANGIADKGISTAEEAIWIDFLNANKINSQALALGSNLGPTASADIAPIAYNGETGTNTNGHIVTDFGALGDILSGLATAASRDENLLTSTLGSGYGVGADGGHLTQIVVDGKTYSYDVSTKALTSDASAGTYSYAQAASTVTINTVHGGKVVVNFDTGGYSYKANPVTGADYEETVKYTITDGDGDTASADLTVQVTYDTTPAPSPMMAFSLENLAELSASDGDHNPQLPALHDVLSAPQAMQPIDLGTLDQASAPAAAAPTAYSTSTQPDLSAYAPAPLPLSHEEEQLHAVAHI